MKVISHDDGDAVWGKGERMIIERGRGHFDCVPEVKGQKGDGGRGYFGPQVLFLGSGFHFSLYALFIHYIIFICLQHPELPASSKYEKQCPLPAEEVHSGNFP